MNGVVENKPYVLGHTLKEIWSILKVPENKFFVLGDNREMSDDSRDGVVSV